jgi:PAS domain S-box-containing protein
VATTEAGTGTGADSGTVRDDKTVISQANTESAARSWSNSTGAWSNLYLSGISLRPCDDDGVPDRSLDRSLTAVTDVLATTPNVMFCIKDTNGIYLSANQAFADRAGVRAPGDVHGKRAADLFPPELVEQYEAQDDEVMRTGHILSNELEAITRPDGSYGWFLTSKSRWTDDAGKPIGIVIVSVDQRTPVDGAAPHRQLASAVEIARVRFAEQLTVSEMAAAAGVSVTQLERLSKRVLGLTPKQLILRFRLEEALRLLDTSTDSIATIASACGYYDQSAFTRHFRRAVGMAPATFRTMSRRGQTKA